MKLSFIEKRKLSVIGGMYLVYTWYLTVTCKYSFFILMSFGAILIFDNYASRKKAHKVNKVKCMAHLLHNGV